MSWLNKLLAPINMSPWKILLQSFIEKYGGDKILYFKKWGLESISDKINPFWRNIYYLICQNCCNQKIKEKQYC
jgi:ribosomal protein S6